MREGLVAREGGAGIVPLVARISQVVAGDKAVVPSRQQHRGRVGLEIKLGDEKERRCTPSSACRFPDVLPLMCVSRTELSSAHVTTWLLAVCGTKRAQKMLRVCLVATAVRRALSGLFHADQTQTWQSSDPERSASPSGDHVMVLTQPVCLHSLYAQERREMREGEDQKTEEGRFMALRSSKPWHSMRRARGRVRRLAALPCSSRAAAKIQAAAARDSSFIQKRLQAA